MLKRRRHEDMCRVALICKASLWSNSSCLVHVLLLVLTTHLKNEETTYISGHPVAEYDVTTENRVKQFKLGYILSEAGQASLFVLTPLVVTYSSQLLLAKM